MKPSKLITTTLLLTCIGTGSHQALASRVDAPLRAKQPKITLFNMTAGFSDVEYIMGNYRRTERLRITTEGSYELTLKNKSKPRTLKTLGATFTSNKGGKLANLKGGDSIILDLQPGLYNLSYFAKTYHPRKHGKFSISLLPPKVDITPSAVPVPAAAWLFGSGLIGLAGLTRRRT